MMYAPRALLVATLAVTSASFGCSVISGLVTSVSDSISGTGNAIVGSSESLSDAVGASSGGIKPTYAGDLREYTASFVRSGAEPSAFSTGATRIAASHGITNWETNGDTAGAIGKGLEDAKRTPAQAQAFCSSVGFSSDLSQKVVAKSD
jgi:hypothetical protein